MRLIKYLDNSINRKEKLYLLQVNKDFITEVEKIRKEIIRDKLEIDNIADLSKEKFICLMENDELNKQTRKLIKRFELKPEQSGVILNYVVQDYWPSAEELNPDSIAIETEILSSGEKRFSLRIDEETSIKDIQKNWPEIKKATGTKRKKKPWIEAERDLFAVTLNQLGFSAKEIIDPVKKIFGSKIYQHNIWKIVSSFKKKSAQISKKLTN